MKTTIKKEMLTGSMMLVITALTQLASVVKSAVIASNFGMGTELDAYNFSNSISLFFGAFITTGIMSILIPAYLRKKDRAAIDTFLTVVFSVTFALLAVTFVFRNSITGMLTNRDDAFQFYVSRLLLSVILIQGATAVHGVTAAYFQCINKYNIPKLIQLFSNVLSVIIIIFLKNFTIYQYVMVLLGSAFVQLCIDIWAAYQYGYRFRPTLALKNAQFKELIKLFVPVIFSTGVFQLHSLTDSFIVSNLQTGQLTLLTYASTIVNMVNTLLVENLVVYLYPKIINSLKVQFLEGEKKLWIFSGFAHYALSLVVVGFIACGNEFVSLIYENGKFGESAVWGVYLGTCIYMLGQPNNVIRDLIYRFFYAAHDTKTPLYNSLLVSAANFVMSFVLARFWGVYGVILGTIVAGAFSLAMIVVRLHKKYGLGDAFKPAAVEYIKTSIISAASVVCVLIIRRFLVTQYDILNLLCYGCIAVVCFVLFSVLFKSKALNKLTHSL